MKIVKILIVSILSIMFGALLGIYAESGEKAIVLVVIVASGYALVEKYYLKNRNK